MKKEKTPYQEASKENQAFVDDFLGHQDREALIDMILERLSEQDMEDFNGAIDHS